MEVFWGGERDLLAGGLDRTGLLGASLSLPLSLSPTFTSTLVLSALTGGGEAFLLLLLLPSALLDGEGGGLGLSICVGLYRS